MKRSFAVAVMACATIASAGIDNGVGESIFNDRGCTMCHAPDMDTVGPSVRTISMRYSGNENGLVMYLKGQGRPIVYPERDGMMRPQLMKIGNLYEDEYRSLARYIIHAFMRVDF